MRTITVAGVLVLLTGAAGAPAAAQQARSVRGAAGAIRGPHNNSCRASLMRDPGYNEGRDYQLEERYAAGS
jgi:hypothetical protein